MKKKAFAWVMTFALMLSLLPATGLTALAAMESNVKYIDANGAEQTCSSATVVGSDTKNWTDGWYVVNSPSTSNLTISGTVTVTGDVHLILVDGCALKVESGQYYGIQIADVGGSLTIYGQTGGTGNLEVTKPTDSNTGFGIGSSHDTTGKCSITINGGTVNTTGNGGGINCSSKDDASITITGGTVTANGKGSTKSYGIYSSSKDKTSEIKITGGTVTANGKGTSESFGIYSCSESTTDGQSSISITGGTVEATCDRFGSGIQSESNADSKLTISGGTVTATNTGCTDDGSCYGICVHSETGESGIIISGGTVTGECTYSETENRCSFSGISISSSSNDPEKKSSICITGGTVTATSKATSTKGSYGIDIDIDKGDIDISGGNEVTVTGTGQAFKGKNPTLDAKQTVKAGSSENDVEDITGEDREKLETNAYKYVKVSTPKTPDEQSDDSVIKPTYTYSDSSSRSTSYSVKTVTEGIGTVSADKNFAIAGNMVTFTAVPNPGWTLEGVTAKDENGKEVTLTEDAVSGTYTFHMPAANVVISASFADPTPAVEPVTEAVTEPVTDPATESVTEPVAESVPVPQSHDVPFGDVGETDWFREAVAYVYGKGLMNGVFDLQFAPYDGSTRAMVVTILWRMAGSPVVNYALPFADVPEEQWYTDAIRWAASTGIVKGISDTEFLPDALVTREELATMIYRYEQSLGNGFEGDWVFLLSQSDAGSVSEWADEAMHWCVMKGVIHGDDQNNLNPQNTATRAEIATIVQNLEN